MKRFIVLIVLVTLLTGCANIQSGKVDNGGALALAAGALPLNQVVAGMRMAMREAAGTWIMEGPNYLLFWWSREGSYYFASLPTSVQAGIIDDLLPTGRCLECFTAARTIRVFEEAGWKVVTASSVPASIRLAILGQSLGATIASIAARGLTSVWMIPITPDIFPDLQPVQVIT